jgi:hypothetical protein
MRNGQAAIRSELHYHDDKLKRIGHPEHQSDAAQQSRNQEMFPQRRKGRKVMIVSAFLGDFTSLRDTFSKEQELADLLRTEHEGLHRE